MGKYRTNQSITTYRILDATIGSADMASGSIVSGKIANTSVVSGSIASGQIMRFHVSSGAIVSGQIGNAVVVSGAIASGQITVFHITSGAGISPGMIAQPTAQSALAGVTRICRADYDIAVDGGIVGTIALIGSTDIPNNAIILGGALVIETALTGGAGATAALQVNAANDLVAATVVTGAPWSTTGNKDVIPAGTGSTAISTTAARDVSLVIGVANLTAGKFQVYLSYIVVA